MRVAYQVVKVAAPDRFMVRPPPNVHRTHISGTECLSSLVNENDFPYPLSRQLRQSFARVLA